MGKKAKGKVLKETAIWPADEISTRNCYNCEAPKQGIYVSCRKGHQMVNMTYNGAIVRDFLLTPCRDCNDFDNSWEV